MRILLLAHAFNSLTQRLFVELSASGHDVSVELDVNDAVTSEAVALHDPQLIIAPFLKRAIPEAIWRTRRCIVIHPGIKGDRGPSSLDWAITRGEREWGVTALQAEAEMDAGAIWATAEFSMRDATKSSLYRHEVTEAAVAAIDMTIKRIVDPHFRPQKLDATRSDVRGRWRPSMRQIDRAIDWQHDDTMTVLRKIRAADGNPGVRDEINGLACYLYDAHCEAKLRGNAGAVIAQRAGAICRATTDGAIWITHLKRADRPQALKLPAATVLGDRIANVPECGLAPDACVDYATWRPIRYAEDGAVGYLHFPFYNGAMGTDDCLRLRKAYVEARKRPTRVIVLMGGDDFWSNGIHLCKIEAADEPAEESWRNINAMNDLVREILATDRQLTIAALSGNAGAGGAFLALATDYVWARDGVVLNPHYKAMGNLYGSEYWTYLLPRRVGVERARGVVERRLPMGARQAVAQGLIDDCFETSVRAFRAETERRARMLADSEQHAELLSSKNARRANDELVKPLEDYRYEELERMKLNFFGFDSSYHVARYNFVFKIPKSRTPSHLATHRVKPLTDSGVPAA